MQSSENTEMRVVSTTINGEKIKFSIMHEVDMIQRRHSKGNFYEVDELEYMAGFLSKGATIIDIGANIGNHAL